MLFADGPINSKKLLNPYNAKTIGALTDLFEKQPLNDNGGSNSGSSEGGSASGESGSGSVESGSGFVEGSSGMEPDSLKALVISVSECSFMCFVLLFVCCCWGCFSKSQVQVRGRKAL